MKAIHNLLNQHIADIIEETEAITIDKQSPKIDLSKNESPFNSPFNKYPPQYPSQLIKKAAVTFDVQHEHIHIGSNRLQIIDNLMRAFCTPTTNIIVGGPSEIDITKQAKINNIPTKQIDFDEQYCIQLNDILKQIDEHTKLIYLSSPNTISGTVLSKSDITMLLELFDGIVILDITYDDYYKGENYLNILKKYQNIVLIKSFSKAWGAAGIQLSLSFACPALIKLLNALQYPFSITNETQNIGQNILSNKYDVFKWTRFVIQERTQVMSAIKLLPYFLHGSESNANFVFVKFQQANKLYQYLWKNTIAVMDCSKHIKCDNCLRISIDFKTNNSTLIAALRQYLQ